MLAELADKASALRKLSDEQLRGCIAGVGKRTPDYSCGSCYYKPALLSPSWLDEPMMTFALSPKADVTF
jgi:hypothetical protein